MLIAHWYHQNVDRVRCVWEDGTGIDHKHTEYAMLLYNIMKTEEPYVDVDTVTLGSLYDHYMKKKVIRQI